MALYGRLIDRVRAWDRQKNLPGQQQVVGRQIDSIVEHLQKVLNSKQGTTLMDEAFGMPDFTDIAPLFPASVREIEKIIERTIERYEPRLLGVHVDFLMQDEQNLSLCFNIKAVMKQGSEQTRVQLESAIDTNGKTVIRG